MSGAWRAVRAWVVGATALTLALSTGVACSDSTGPAFGTIQVIVTTAGAQIDRDPDGYTVSIDGGPGPPVTATAAFLIENLPRGSHVLGLEGLAPNCSVGGPNPRTVELAMRKATASVQVSFSVSCVSNTGSIQVTAVTSGADPDPDGYFVLVGGSSRGDLPANGARKISGLREGLYAVALAGLSGNCAIEGPNPPSVSIKFGVNVDVAFAIKCVEAAGLILTVATSGASVDPNGYILEARLEGTSVGTSVIAPRNGSVTMSSLRPGDYVLTLLEVMPNCDAVTSNPWRVTVSAGPPAPIEVAITCTEPVQLAFVNGSGDNADIYLVSSGGGAISRISLMPGSDADPAWSPDGTRIAFSSNRDGNHEIYLMSANGTSALRLTNTAGADYRPAWSQDGSRIAFVSERDGNPEIYVIDSDGTNFTRLTNNSTYDKDPAWSPDGSRIVFASDREGKPGLWVMNSDGSAATQLTSNARGDQQPSWSPDGARIAFSRQISSATSAIFMVNADGSNLVRLVQDWEIAADPAWSPDGRKIAFAGLPSYDFYYSSHAQITVVSPQGVLYSSPTDAQAFNPAWRP